MTKDFTKNIVNEPEIFKSIKLPPENLWQRIMQRIGIKKPDMLNIEIQGATYRTAKKISLMILDMRTESDFDGDDKVFDIMQSSFDDLAKIIATAVHNKPTPVPQRYVDAIMDGITNEEGKTIVAEVYRRLDIANFFVSMGFLKNMTVQIGTQETQAMPLSSETQN
jgi:hypothetical protein